jgi:hypothetical protein
MKNCLFILSLFLIFSACSDEKQIYFQYCSQFKESIKLLENKNQIIYLDFKDFASEHRPKGEPWYNKMLMIKQGKDKLFFVCDSIIENAAKMPLSDILRNIEEENKMDIKVMLNKTDIDLLSNKINTYKSNIISTLYDKKRHMNYLNEINIALYIENFDSTNTFCSKQVSLAELVADIYRLKSDIIVAENIIFNFIWNLFDDDNFKFNRREVFIIPNSQKITTGQTYIAEILLCDWDTTCVPIFEIDGKTHTTASGKGVYKFRVTEKPGKYEKTGNSLIKSPYTGEIQKIPFKIEYEVLEKK